MYGRSGHRTFKKKELREWEELSLWEIKRQHRNIKKILGPVKLDVKLFYKRDRDIDNLKPILDILEEGGIVDNDSQVVVLIAKKHKDTKNPRFEVDVSEKTVGPGETIW